MMIQSRQTQECLKSPFLQLNNYLAKEKRSSTLSSKGAHSIKDTIQPKERKECVHYGGKNVNSW